MTPLNLVRSSADPPFGALALRAFLRRSRQHRVLGASPNRARGPSSRRARVLRASPRRARACSRALISALPSAYFEKVRFDRTGRSSSGRPPVERIISDESLCLLGPGCLVLSQAVVDMTRVPVGPGIIGVAKVLLVERVRSLRFAKHIRQTRDRVFAKIELHRLVITAFALSTSYQARLSNFQDDSLGRLYETICLCRTDPWSRGHDTAPRQSATGHGATAQRSQPTYHAQPVYHAPPLTRAIPPAAPHALAPVASRNSPKPSPTVKPTAKPTPAIFSTFEPASGPCITPGTRQYSGPEPTPTPCYD